jgi:hypothetical protein
MNFGSDYDLGMALTMILGKDSRGDQRGREWMWETSWLYMDLLDDFQMG